MSDSLRKNEKLYYVKFATAVILAAAVLFPIYMMLASSFKPSTDVFDQKVFPAVFSVEGYKLAWKQDFLRYFLNSLFISSTVTVVALIFHAMAGYTLARVRFAGKRFIFLWILSTMMIPFSVIMIPLFILIKQFNWLNSFKGIIIPAIPHAYGIFLFRQFFITMPRDLEEAATIDGCSSFGIFASVYLPLAKSISITLAVAFFIANWNNYLWPLVVSQKQEMWVLQVAIANFISRNETPWDAIMAAGVITVVPTVIMFFMLQKYLVEGIKLSGIK